MARRAKSGWELPHNKRPLKGPSLKDLRRRRLRRGLAEQMRETVRGMSPGPRV